MNFAYVPVLMGARNGNEWKEIMSDGHYNKLYTIYLHFTHTQYSRVCEPSEIFFQIELDP